MTRSKANEVLFLWKVGAELFPVHVINQALRATGDLGPVDLGRKEREDQPRNEISPDGPSVVWRTARAGGNSDAILEAAR